MINKKTRIVITGIGLTAPNGNNLTEYRQALLSGKSGITNIEHRYIGKVHAGTCNFDTFRYQKRKELRYGTRAGSISIYCANEALQDSALDWNKTDKSKCGIFLGITEHGSVETENEIFNLHQFNDETRFWNHYHNPRTVANNPAGETSIKLGITGPHYTIGAACAAGNSGIIQGVQQLLLDEIDVAFAGGVSECTGSFGIFASFKSQNALAHHSDPTKASRPFDVERNGIVVSEGGCIFILERLEDAKKRDARIYAEIVGYSLNSDAYSFVLPFPERQKECMLFAMKKAEVDPSEIDLVNTHATGTKSGDFNEAEAIKNAFRGSCPYINNTKGYIGHTMGAAGALELAGNIPSFADGIIHPCMNIDNLDPDCRLDNLVIKAPCHAENINIIMNNSFGMLGINSAVIIKRYTYND
jgi:3-oxoacyl-[acyl-carrier-protein] synthase II